MAMEMGPIRDTKPFYIYLVSLVSLKIKNPIISIRDTRDTRDTEH
jgi:hypothetical protein